MASIPALLDGHVTLEVECLDRLYLNGYIGGLATPGGLVTFMRVQLGKPVASPVVLGQVTEKFREAVKVQAERQQIPVYQFQHKERKDEIANEFRRQRGVRDQIVFIGVAQEKAKAFSGTKVNGQFQFNRDKTVYVNHYYFYIDDEDFGPMFLKGLSNLPYLQKLGRQINRRLLEVERVSHNSGLSGDSIQRVVQPTVNEEGEKAPALKFGQPRVMALFLALTLFQHLIDGFHNRDLRQLVADLLGVTIGEYTGSQMTYDLRRLRLKGLIFRPPRTNRYFVTPYGWKVARLFSRLEARVFRPAIAMFTSNDAVLPFPLRASLDRVDNQLDQLIYQAFPQTKAS
jgi:hypothetical protein